MSDLHDLLKASAPRPSTAVDLDAIRDGISTRRRRRHAGQGLLSVALIAVAALGVSALLTPPDAGPVIEQPSQGTDLGLGPGWTRLADAPLPPRTGAALVAVDDHRVAVLGGANEASEFLTDGAILDLTTGTWAALAPAPFDVYTGNAARLGDGIVAVGLRPAGAVGALASPAAVLDLTTNAWRDLPAIPGDSVLAIQVLGVDDHVVVTSRGDPPRMLRLIDDQSAWEPVPASPLPPPAVAAARPVMTDDGARLVQVGASSDTGLLAVAAYDVAAHEWEIITDTGPLLDDPARIRVFPVDGGLVVLGDTDVVEDDPRDTFYSFAADTWTQIRGRPTVGRALESGCCWLPSSSGRFVTDFDVKLYDSVTGEWLQLDAPPALADRASTAWVGGALVTFGGSDFGPVGDDVADVPSATTHVWVPGSNSVRPEPSEVATTQPDLSPSQSAADAARDGVAAPVAALAFDARVDPTSTVSTPEGIWIASMLPPATVASTESLQGAFLGNGDGRYGVDYVSAASYAEILLLDPDSLEIVRAWPLTDFPNLRLTATPDAVWAHRDGDGGLPDGLVVRIDRTTMDLRGRVIMSDIDSSFTGDFENVANNIPLPADVVVRALADDSAPATQGEVAWFGDIGFDEAFDRLPLPDGWVVSDGRDSFLVAGETVTPVDGRTLEPQAPPLAPASDLIARLPAASITPLVLALDTSELVSWATGIPEVLTSGVLAHARGPEGFIGVMHDDGSVEVIDPGPPSIVRDAGSVVPERREEGLSRVAGFEKVSLAMSATSIAWWTPGGLTTLSRPDALSTGDRDMLGALEDFARDPGPETFALLPFADDVALGLGPDIDRIVSYELLAEPSTWSIDRPDGYAEFSGPFSALERVASSDARDGIVGPHAHCAGPPQAAPDGFEDARRVSLQRTDATSCIDWWSVDLFLLDGSIVAVTLSLFGP